MGRRGGEFGLLSLVVITKSKRFTGSGQPEVLGMQYIAVFKLGI